MDRHSARRPSDEDAHLTVRVPLSFVGLATAALLHVFAVWGIGQLPEPEPPPPPPIEFTLVPSSPAPPPPTAPPEKPTPKKPRRRPPPRATTPAPAPEVPAPAPSPVAPELAPSEDPPENRAQLPIVEPTPEVVPAPPPEPMSWEDQLRAQLARTTPRRAPAPTGVLAPPAGVVERVAASDPRLHDEENERRLMVDHGAFFRRGLESLRGNWHPNDALDRTERAVSQRCARRTRTTYAVAVLDREGHVVDVDMKRGSGCEDLDDEAVAAFKRVAQFPRPPRGIFTGPDGIERETARFPVRFIVRFDGGLQLDWSAPG